MQQLDSYGTLMSRVFFAIFLGFISSSSIAGAIEPIFAVNLEKGTSFENSSKLFYGDTIMVEDGKLFLLFKGEKLELFENKIIEGNRGVKVVGIKLWDTGSEIGQLLIVEYADYYSTASNYGQSNALIIFRLTARINGEHVKPVAIKLGEVGIGSSGKGFDKIGVYMLKRMPLGLYELVIFNNQCDYLNYGAQCIKSTYKLDLNDNKVSLSNSKRQSVSPSFDCQGDTTYLEKQICLSQILSNLDLILAELYKSSNVNDKKASQRKWLRDRNSCKSIDDVESCLIESYNSRIQYFIQNR